MKRTIYIVCLFFLSLKLNAQTKADSLESLLSGLDDSVSKIEVLDELLKLRYSSDPDQALEYGKEAVEIAKQLDNKEWISKTTNNVGIICYLQGKYDESVNYYSQALLLDSLENDKKGIATTKGNIANVYRAKGDYGKAIIYNKQALLFFEELKDSSATARIYNSIANIQNDKGEYSLALDNFFKSLKIYESLKDEKEIARLYSNVATIYYNQMLYDEALNYFQSAYDIQDKYQDNFGKATSLSNMGNVHHQNNQFEKALELHEQALTIREDITDKPGQAESRMHIAEAYELKGESEKAEIYFQSALELNREIGHKRNTTLTLLALGGFYVKIKKYDKALRYLQEAENVGREMDAKRELERVFQKNAEAFAGLGNYKSAYEQHVRFYQLHDSIYTSESSELLREMQTKYDTDKQKQKIASLSLENKVKDAENKRQRQFQFGMLLGLVLLFGFILFGIRAYRTIGKEKKRAESLLLNILPAEVAEELKEKGKARPRYYEKVTVLFTDFRGFTFIAEKLSPTELVEEIDYCYKAFDVIITKYNIEKIKTIGDAYMAAAGLPIPDSDNPLRMVKAALEIRAFMLKYKKERELAGKPAFEIRIGLHTGPVVAGVVGFKKFAYDIWGDAVNTAARMESSSEPGKVNVSGAVFRFLNDSGRGQHELAIRQEAESPAIGTQFKNLGFLFTYRGKVKAKNKGLLDMYFVDEQTKT